MSTASHKAGRPAAAKNARARDDGAHRYCAQPIQVPRQFDSSVSAGRVSAIIASSKKWVNGTQLTYYCFKRGDGVPAAWQGSADDIGAVDDAFEAWAKLGIGLSSGPSMHPKMPPSASASTRRTARGPMSAATCSISAIPCSAR